MRISIFLQLAVAWAAVVPRDPASLPSHRAGRKPLSRKAGNGDFGVHWDTVPLNTVLYWISNLFPFNILVKNAGDLTTHAENTLVSILGVSATQDTVTDNQCANITILFARGTSEVGNVGIIVGPEFLDAVAARLSTGSTLAVRGVEYPASIPGFLQGGDPAGSHDM
jgi:hypothetical protein